MASIVTLQPTWEEATEQFSREYWTAVMKACDANVCEMARVSGVNRTQLYKILKRFKVELPKRARHYGDWGDLSNEAPIA
jgi:transcriptional regulator of acetoin/glycerol metabolism